MTNLLTNSSVCGQIQMYTVIGGSEIWQQRCHPPLTKWGEFEPLQPSPNSFTMLLQYRLSLVRYGRDISALHTLSDQPDSPPDLLAMKCSTIMIACKNVQTPF